MIGLAGCFDLGTQFSESQTLSQNSEQGHIQVKNVIPMIKLLLLMSVIYSHLLIPEFYCY